MLNSITEYENAGRKAAQARHNRDEATAQFYENWRDRAVALETPEDRVRARMTYADAYTDEARQYTRSW
jgi:hypothetical protein